MWPISIRRKYWFSHLTAHIVIVLVLQESFPVNSGSPVIFLSINRIEFTRLMPEEFKFYKNTKDKKFNSIFFNNLFYEIENVRHSSNV